LRTFFGIHWHTDSPTHFVSLHLTLAVHKNSSQQAMHSRDVGADATAMQLGTTDPSKDRQPREEEDCGTQIKGWFTSFGKRRKEGRKMEKG